MSIRCWNIRRHLSAHHDRELSSVAAARVSRHVETCRPCRRILDDLGRVSQAVAGLEPLPAPAHVWQAIDRTVADETWRQADSRPILNRWLTVRVAAVMVGALALVAIGLLLPWVAELRTARQAPHAMPHAMPHATAFDVGPYLEAVAGGFARSVGDFEAQYQARPASVADAATAVGFEPVAPVDLPGGWRRADVHLLKDVCCHVIRFVYRRDGASLVLFEQAADHPLTCSGNVLRDGRTNGFGYQSARRNEAGLVTWTAANRRFTMIAEEPDYELVSVARWLTTREPSPTPVERR